MTELHKAPNRPKLLAMHVQNLCLQQLLSESHSQPLTRLVGTDTLLCGHTVPALH